MSGRLGPGEQADDSPLPEGRTRPVLIGVDGRSGSGKTTLAAALKDRLAAFTDVHVLALEEMYPGWDGLSAVTHDDGPYVDALRRLYLGSPAEIPTWDWHGSRPGPVRTLRPAEAVVCEGVGALCRGARGLLTLGVWVDADDRVRRDRALARDGETYAPHWERWAEQEERYLAAHAPAAAADLQLRLH